MNTHIKKFIESNDTQKLLVLRKKFNKKFQRNLTQSLFQKMVDDYLISGVDINNFSDDEFMFEIHEEYRKKLENAFEKFNCQDSGKILEDLIEIKPILLGSEYKMSKREIRKKMAKYNKTKDIEDLMFLREIFNKEYKQEMDIPFFKEALEYVLKYELGDNPLFYNDAEISLFEKIDDYSFNNLRNLVDNEIIEPIKTFCTHEEMSRQLIKGLDKTKAIILTKYPHLDSLGPKPCRK